MRELATVLSLFKTKESAPTYCHICDAIVDTRVDVSFLKCQFFFGILCCCGYILMLIPLLAFSPIIPILRHDNFDGFRLYRHYCPDCDTYLGNYSPKMSCGEKLCLFMISMLILVLCSGIIFLVIYIGYIK